MVPEAGRVVRSRARSTLGGLAAHLLALSLGGGLAADPCVRTALLAEKGAGHLAEDGPSEVRLGFRLKAEGPVWAEAAGLGGLRAEDRDAAPEVFLDDSYLGPLLAAAGGSWRSPQALVLEPGRHVLLVRRADAEGGARAHWSRLRVLGDEPCAARARRPESAKGPAP